MRVSLELVETDIVLNTFFFALFWMAWLFFNDHLLILYEMAFQFSSASVQLLSHVQLFATPWIAAHQASLSITSSWSLLKLMSIESVMPSSHLILCRPLLLLPPIPPSIRIFSNESALCMRWPKYWSFSISLSNEHPGLIYLASILIRCEKKQERDWNNAIIINAFSRIL